MERQFPQRFNKARRSETVRAAFRCYTTATQRGASCPVQVLQILQTSGNQFHNDQSNNRLFILARRKLPENSFSRQEVFQFSCGFGMWFGQQVLVQENKRALTMPLNCSSCVINEQDSIAPLVAYRWRV